MIRQMNKYAFLIFHREYEEFLAYIQGLGVIHITQRVKPQEEETLKALNEERLQVKALIQRLRPWLSEDYTAPEQVLPQGEMVKDKATTTLASYDNLVEEVKELSNQVAQQELWGEFDVEQVKALEQAGYKLSAYTTSALVYTESYEAEYDCIPLCRRGMQQYFLRLEHTDSLPVPEAERQALPTERLSVVSEQLQSKQAALLAYEEELRRLAPELIEGLQGYDMVLEDRFSFGAAKLQGEAKAEDKLLFLEGWIPTDEAPALEAQLASTGYYYKACDITEEDKVPISLKNNALVRGFEVITRMFSLPNYGEIDQTVLFAPFFMLFFGLCLGDAGYGLIILLVTTYLRFKAKPDEDKSLYTFIQLLGLAAFGLGMLTGSLFGVTLPYAESKDYFLNQDNLMLLSIGLGLTQIFFAKGVAAYKTKKQKGTKYALAPVAWIFFLLALGLMLALPALGWTLPEWGHYALYGIVGLTLLVILFYNDPKANPFVNVGSALWTAYNTASGLLGDTLSYIRLFAIGLTGAILGSVFNTLAIDTTEGLNAFVRFPLMLIILLVGHGLNFAIAMIGALVHPIRLTFVEYYKNSEFEGGGIEYNPFKQKVQEANK